VEQPEAEPHNCPLSLNRHSDAATPSSQWVHVLVSMATGGEARN
jgi:hypothetical protein